MPQEFKALDSLIGVLLGTNAATKQTTKQALARANGRPYDPQRLELFENVVAQLRTFPFAGISEPARQGPARTVFAFAESYFSNYIEGTTVVPELVPGTLKEAFGLTQTFSHPMQIALFAMLLVAEAHPFQDGNVRTSRLLMNSYLSNKAQCRIIVPTVYREDFILSLKTLTNQANANAFIRAMRLCQEWTCQLPQSGAWARLS